MLKALSHWRIKDVAPSRQVRVLLGLLYVKQLATLAYTVGSNQGHDFLKHAPSIRHGLHLEGLVSSEGFAKIKKLAVNSGLNSLKVK